MGLFFLKKKNDADFNYFAISKSQEISLTIPDVS
jgi:hypothetical protein